ncbi:MAG: alpha-2-macroglobulin, partial [Bacteroidetes bacterium]
MYDASLDAFAPNRWNLNLYPTWGSARGLRTYGFATQRSRHFTYDWNPPTGMPSRRYPRLNWFGFQVNERYYRHLALEFEDQSIQESMALEEVAVTGRAPARKEAALAYSADAVEVQQDNTTAGVAGEPPAPPETQAPPPPPPVRTNLDETVFFFPRLMTDADGNVVIRFTMNEALTRWNFLTLAHTTDLKVGTSLREVVTQKELMVLPNPPRFFREGDEIEFTAKVVNLSERTLSGNAELQLVNPLKTVPVYKWLDNPQFNQHFRVKPGQSARVAWRFRVPEVSEVPLIEHTVLAVAGDFSDAERSVAPVLSNRMLVTESMPLPIGGKEEKTFTFERLRDARSPTLRHHALTLEFTSNPAWYAVQALPYLMEFPHECSEQLFNRFYANALAGSVANAHPKIRAVFEKWRDYQPDALLSNLSKNEELKSALLEETPWVLHAQSEEQQKRNIALLFDLNRMSYELENALAKLQERQLPGGGFAWFPGGRDNWYITQYIVEGMGHLDRLGVRRITDDDATWSMVRDAVRYCDERIVEHYETLERRVEEGHTSWDKDHLDPIAIHYLYARSFFLEDLSAQAATGTEKPGRSAKYLPLEGKARTVFDYYLGQAEKFWLGKGIYQEGMLSLALHRLARGATVEKMIASFKERALQDEERGMYWKYPSGWWWWQMPIETHALMIEVFEEAARDPEAVHRLKVWLLKNKQTTHWKTTKATAGAVYALLMSGENWLLEDEPLQIR